MYYKVTSNNELFSGIEAGDGGSYRFFYLKPQANVSLARNWLASPNTHQNIVDEIQGDGQLILITRDNHSLADFHNVLRSEGIILESPLIEKKIDPWVVRGHVSNAGQALQLYSSIAKGNLKPDLLAFSALSLTANYINIAFGSEKEKDDHRLLHIKRELHSLFACNGISGLPEPKLGDHRMADDRYSPELPLSPKKRIHGFVARNSVRFGEVGLRLVGLVGMIFPVDRWGTMSVHLKEGAIGKAMSAGLNPNQARRYGGIIYFAGKFASLFSKTPDPYNPAPRGKLDVFREKYLFKASSVVEAGAASIVAAGAFTGDFHKGAKIDRSDYIGGAGASVLAAGLAGRTLAPFGEKILDAEEVFAYTENIIAKSPHEKIPGLIGKAALLLSKELGGSKSVGDIYTRLTEDLYQFHNLTMDRDMAMTGKERPPAPVISQRKHASTWQDITQKSRDALPANLR